MSLQIIIGGAGSGKSEQLTAELAQRAQAQPEDRFYVIVPEQATLNMQQRVVRHARNQVALNIDVVSFNRLAQVVFADLGADVSNVLDDTGKVLVLRRVLEACREDLTVYKSKVRMPGFSQKMKSAVTELTQYGIDDNELYLMQESAQQKNNPLLYAKLQDLRLIRRRFDEEIRDAFRASEELLSLFASKVGESERLRGSHIYLDGFTGFTPVQYRLLKELMKYAQDVTVTVILPKERIKEPCPEYDLFSLSNQTLSRLLQAAQEAGTEAEIREVQRRQEKESGRLCRIFPAADPGEEVIFAAKEILRLTGKEGLRYREIAVVVTDMEAYHFLIEKTFREAGIPCFIDHKSGIAEHPLSRFCLAAFDLLEQRFSYDSVFSFLKTGLTDIPREDIDLIENYCLEFGIRGARAWEKEMVRNRPLHGPEPTEDQLAQDRFAGQAWNLDEINRIRALVYDGIADFCRAVRREGAGAADYVRALKGLLRRNRIREQLSEKAESLKQQGRLKEQMEYEQVYELVEELLNKTEALSGEAPLTVKEYMNILESGLSEIRVGVIPPTLDTLMAGDLTRTRLENIRVLFLLGADESRIPSASQPSGVFSARDREFLKSEHFEIAPTAVENLYIQRFYLYLMLSKPKELLYITWAAAGADGEQNGPSYILDELEELAPSLSGKEAAEMPSVRWKRQALKEMAGQIRKEPEEALLSFFAGEEPALLRRITDAAFYTNAQTPLDSQVALDLYGEVLSGSVSRYEKFSECPFKHYLTYGIRLEKRPEYEVAATDVGTIYHNALEIYSRSLEEEGYSFRDVPEEISTRIAEESVEAALDNLPSDVMESSARNEFFMKRIREVAVKTTRILREQVRAGLFEPDRYEMEFKESLSDQVRFRGKIDRVDIYDAEDLFIKIIDYKSGQKAFKIDDIYSGLQLQLVAYLKEAIDVYAEQNPGRRVRPGGVYYYLINDRFAKNEEEALDRFKLSGLTSCESGVIPAMDQALSGAGEASSRIISVKLKKNGELHSASQVANDGEFSNLMNFVSGKIEEISRRILAGEISPEPWYEQERSNACSFCDFKDVCKFEAGSFGTDWKKKTELSKKEMEAEIYGRIQAE